MGTGAEDRVKRALRRMLSKTDTGEGMGAWESDTKEKRHWVIEMR